MRVKIIYRNYKPLHDLYASFMIEPPEDVAFIIPAPRQCLWRFLPLHRRLGGARLARRLLPKVQELLFRGQEDDADLYHFAQLIGENVPRKPYVVDFEHVTTLASFSTIDQTITQKIFRFLDDSQCRKIIPLSRAARTALQYLLSDDEYDQIASKLEVVYPALPSYYALLRDEVDYSHVDANSETFKLLFVGNGARKKGLYELLEAFQRLEGKHDDMFLYVVSDAAGKLGRRYPSDRIRYFAPRFSHRDIVRKFYIPCDLFVLPTHSDSFGMALLYSLSSGTPVLTTEQFAAPEIVRPGYNGLFVRSDELHLNDVPLPSRDTWNEFVRHRTVEMKLVDELVSRIEHLHLHRDLLCQMGRQAVKDFEPGGKFSIEVRNATLGRIYRSCLGNPASSSVNLRGPIRWSQ